MTILLADDHPLFIQGLKNLLEVGGYQVIGMARDGAEAVTAARRLRPDVILMDIDMPVCDGITATRRIKAELPQSRIVMLTVSADEEALFEAIRSGASGYLLKNLDAEGLFSCLEQLDQGEIVLSPCLARRIRHEFAAGGEVKKQKTQPLTAHQEKILSLVATGCTYKQTAARLGISEATIKYHMANILERLQLDTRAQAIAYITRTNRT